MKKYALLLVHLACASVLFTMACTNPVQNKLKGKWLSKDKTVKLNITDKDFIMDDGQAIAENYFVKGDTIFTSFQGNLPYTGFVVKKLEEHYMKLMGPDSVAIEYNR